jgi:hypothetical protein
MPFFGPLFCGGGPFCSRRRFSFRPAVRWQKKVSPVLRYYKIKRKMGHLLLLLSIAEAMASRAYLVREAGDSWRVSACAPGDRFMGLSDTHNAQDAQGPQDLSSVVPLATDSIQPDPTQPGSASNMRPPTSSGRQEPPARGVWFGVLHVGAAQWVELDFAGGNHCTTELRVCPWPLPEAAAWRDVCADFRGGPPADRLKLHRATLGVDGVGGARNLSFALALRGESGPGPGPGPKLGSELGFRSGFILSLIHI